MKNAVHLNKFNDIPPGVVEKNVPPGVVEYSDGSCEMSFKTTRLVGMSLPFIFCLSAPEDILSLYIKLDT